MSQHVPIVITVRLFGEKLIQNIYHIDNRQQISFEHVFWYTFNSTFFPFICSANVLGT